jgi:hypothetical protein
MKPDESRKCGCGSCLVTAYETDTATVSVTGCWKYTDALPSCQGAVARGADGVVEGVAPEGAAKGLRAAKPTCAGWGQVSSPRGG